MVSRLINPKSAWAVTAGAAGGVSHPTEDARRPREGMVHLLSSTGFAGVYAFVLTNGCYLRRL